MRGFAYRAVGSVKEAARVLSKDPGAAVMAGGTDLLGVLKDAVHPSSPGLVLGLNPAGLRHIEEKKEGLWIGAMATLSDLASHPGIPLLARAARSVASPQIRNMGTLGGNICQEPRCWYYRTPEDLFHCLRKGGGKCGAFFGDNRYHSIFGASRMAASACSHSCPNHTDVPAVLASMRRKDIASAAAKLLEVNPMPAVTGRLCPHPCERDCNRAGCDEPVSIREVERFLGDYCLAHADALYKAPKSFTRKQAAVVGAGPAGLSAAYFLRKAGHRVRVFERLPAPGGMLACGIPAYRLPREVVDKVVAALERMGVEIELNAEIGSLKPLRRDFDAVFVGTGLWRDKKLGIAGEERLGSGLEFLMAARAGKASCSGKRVLVIGGGSVAVDVAVSAARLGARSVAMACLESRSEMPAFPEDIEQALQEKVELLPSWGPLRVLDRGLELVRCVSVFDAEKRFRPVFDPSVTRVFAADEVILAIGLCADKKLETHLKGVFAGGDGASGPGSVASAIAAGRKAAQEMDLYLTGKKRRSKSEAGPMLEFNPAALERSERARVPAPRRKIDAEDRGTLSEAAVLDEAQRCGNCGCVAVNASDLAPALVALGAKIKTSNRTLKACEFFASRPLKTTVLEQGELVCEVFVPKPKAGARQGFSKFRLRNAIDFAIVSAAWVLDVRDGKIRDASIVLGAVGPVPVRLREVEEFLRGRAVDEATAARAGELAVRECHPLARNGFKVQVVKALVRRAVLGES